jgi:hypothetical protein
MTPRGWLILVGAATAASIAAEVVFHDAAHALYWWHAVPGLDLGLGLAGCAAIVAASKLVGRWVLRADDYYDGDRQ